MKDTLSNGDVKASCTTAGAECETIAASRPPRDFRAVAACGGVASLAAVVIGAGVLIKPPTASAVPSFARQTGQPCATCHTAFPELTPYGREFKLRGYTSGGTRCGDVDRFTEEGAAEEEMQIPIAGMTTPVFTHVQKGLPDNNNSVVQQTSVFLGGQIYCNLG